MNRAQKSPQNRKSTAGGFRTDPLFFLRQRNFRKIILDFNVNIYYNVNIKYRKEKNKKAPALRPGQKHSRSYTITTYIVAYFRQKGKKMFVTESLDDRGKNDKIRAEIVRSVFRICKTRELNIIMRFVHGIEGEDIFNYPMKITDIACMLEEDDVMSILNVVKDMDMNKIAAKQIKEAFSLALKQYSSTADE